MSDWREKAKCKGKHTDPWYPPMESANPSQYYWIGAAVCERCPVWDVCLEDGKGETWGMWGGLTPQERRAMASQSGPGLRAHGTTQRYRQGCNCQECQDAAYGESASFDMLFIPDSDEKFVIEEVKSSIMRLLGQSTL